MLEHIPDLDGALADIHRVLRTGGKVFLTVPSHRFADMLFGTDTLRALGLSGLSRAYANWFNRHSRHHHTDDSATWDQRLRSHGFAVKRSYYYVSRPALHAFDLAHYLSLGRLISHRLTGKWVLMRIPVITSMIEAWLRRHCDDAPRPDGAYLFIEAEKL